MEKLNLLDLLRNNPYPGRGIVLGKSADGKQAVAVYFIMGRSENSRNRIFTPTGDGTFGGELKSRAFEPDAPNYTPRISGLLSPDGSFQLSILKSAEGNPDCCCRYFYHYDAPLPGEGRFLHTYMGDGNPLPSFAGDPERVALDAGTPEELAEQVWEALNPENKVSLFVRFVDLSDGSHRDVIRNRY